MPSDVDIMGNEYLSALKSLVESFDSQKVRYAIIGGLATTLRGRPRFTQDVDVLLDVPQLSLPALLDELTSRGFDIDRDTAIREYLRENLTVFRFGTVRIDWIRPMLPIYAQVLAGATTLSSLEGQTMKVASAEGLILTKMVSFRPQDQADIETLIAANRDDLNTEFIRQEWTAFSAGENGRTEWLGKALTGQ